MDSQTRINQLLRKGCPDRVGLFDHFWPETPRLWLDQGYPTADGSPPDTETPPADPAVFFGFDMRPCGGWFDVNPLRGYREVLEETDEWQVVRNGAGAALKYWKHKSGTPEHIDFRMTSREIWERDYRSYLLSVDPQRMDIPAHRRALEAGRAEHRWTFYGHLFIFETMRQSMGDITMYESLALDPGWIHDYNRVYTDFFKAHYRALFEQAGLPDGIWVYEDLGYRNGLFASPRLLQQLIFPYFAELVAFFHAYDLPVVLHSCGGITKALPLIVEAGFDALNPMEVKAGCDLFAFAEQYGDDLAFIGGLDVRILESNDRETIRRGVSEIIEGMKARNARYVFGTDHSVTPNVRYDSYRYALEVYEAHRDY
jgi:uroporphyrinogen decarboxylase